MAVVPRSIEDEYFTTSELLEWALAADVKPAAAKLLLVGLVKHADLVKDHEHSLECFPSQRLLVKYLGTRDRSYVSKLATVLVKAGLIERVEQHHADFSGRFSSTIYKLLYSPPGSEPEPVPSANHDTKALQRTVRTIDRTDHGHRNQTEPPIEQNKKEEAPSASAVPSSLTDGKQPAGGSSSSSSKVADNSQTVATPPAETPRRPARAPVRDADMLLANRQSKKRANAGRKGRVGLDGVLRINGAEVQRS